jgi:transposase
MEASIDGSSYSLDLHERVVAAMVAGISGREAAKYHNTGEPKALRWARRMRETGSPRARPLVAFFDRSTLVYLGGFHSADA